MYLEKTLKYAGTYHELYEPNCILLKTKINMKLPTSDSKSYLVESYILYAY